MSEKNKSISKKNAEMDEQPAAIMDEQPKAIEKEAKVDDGYNVKGKVSVPRLNVREKASSASNILGVISEGDIVNIDDSLPNANFYKVFVVVGGTSVYGYCAKQFIQIVK